MKKFSLQHAHLVPHVWDALEKLERTGWVMRGIPNPETVAEHTIAMGEIAVSVLENTEEFSSEDKRVILDMIEVHDWPEYVVGDLVAYALPEKDRAEFNNDKHLKEGVAMKEISSFVGGEKGEYLYGLWREYEESKTPRAKFVKQIDKLQAVVKACVYEKKHDMKGLTIAFKDGSGSVVKHKALMPYIEKINSDLNIEQTKHFDPLCSDKNN